MNDMAKFECRELEAKKDSSKDANFLIFWSKDEKKIYLNCRIKMYERFEQK